MKSFLAGKKLPWVEEIPRGSRDDLRTDPNYNCREMTKIKGRIYAFQNFRR
jgi:hypothetical protein